MRKDGTWKPAEGVSDNGGRGTHDGDGGVFVFWRGGDRDTGAASGIGKAVAHGLAKAGATVALIDRDQKGLASASRELRASVGLCCDVTQVAEVTQALGGIRKKFGT